MSFKSLRQVFLLVLLTGMLLPSCTPKTADPGIRLAQWRKGVWISGAGTYTVYTATHYFVLSYEGDSTAANLYFGVSQTCYCSKGQARKQVMRLRQMPGRDLQTFRDIMLRADHMEEPLVIDTTLFAPGICNIQQGIIYDSITEATDEYILLATCNGDKEKIFRNGVSIYLPADGGEFYSYRVEEL